MNYRAHPAISGTDARLIVKDYEAWAFERRLKLTNELPVWMERDPTEAMLFGTAVHMAVLEPEEYARKAVVMPYVESFAHKAGRDIKMAYLERTMALEGGFLLKQEAAWAIEQIVKNFAPVRKEFPGNWECEVEKISTHKSVGIKGIIDAATPDYLIDVKTTRDITRIHETVASERYNIQLAHYQQLMPRENTAIIFIESVLPFRVTTMKLDAELMQISNNAWQIAMDKAIEDGLAV